MAAVTLQCRYCRGKNTVDEKDIEERHFITCAYCREVLAVTEFESEQLKYKRKLEEGEKAKQALEKAEKARKEEQEKVWQIISDMDGLKGSLEEQERQLGEILKTSQADQETQGTILSFLRAMNHDQAQGQKSILSVLDQIADGQDTAQGKLSAIQSATAALTEEHTDILKAISEVTGLLHADIEQKNQATFELFSWFSNRNEEEQERLKQLNSISVTLLKGQEKSAAEISNLRKTAEETQKTLKSLEGKMDQQKREALVNLYHQAENLQLDLAFDKAEDEYRKVIVNGGKDPEVYWRIILCHYGVVYQKDNEGNRIPTILRPDLSPAFSAVQELENSCRTKKEREYYTPELKRITDLLEKYRHCQMTAHYDVFISVKQKMHYNGREAFTEDYKIGSDLYQYLTKKGLRVFNSEQEDCKKPGEEWEPYILAALLSSKVMIVVGASKENMESQWVRNEWQRFQWLQAEEIKKTGKTDRRLLCFIDNMTGNDLPRGLAPIQAIINKAGAYQQLDQAMPDSFPNPGKPSEQLPGRREGDGVELTRARMRNWLTFKQFDLVRAEYQKVIREGIYSLDVRITLYNICAEHELNKVEKLETASFDLEQEETVQIILENSRDPEELRKLEELLKKNKENRSKERTEKEKPPEKELNDELHRPAVPGINKPAPGAGLQTEEIRERTEKEEPPEKESNDELHRPAVPVITEPAPGKGLQAEKTPKHTSREKRVFWEKHLHFAHYKNVFTGDMMGKMIHILAERTNISFTYEDVMAVVYVSRGLLRGYFAVIITARCIFICNELANIKIYFANIDSVTGIRLKERPRKCQLNIKLKSGRRSVIDDYKRDNVPDPIDFIELASVLNTYIREFAEN